MGPGMLVWPVQEGSLATILSALSPPIPVLVRGFSHCLLDLVGPLPLPHSCMVRVHSPFDHRGPGHPLARGLSALQHHHQRLCLCPPSPLVSRFGVPAINTSGKLQSTVHVCGVVQLGRPPTHLPSPNHHLPSPNHYLPSSMEWLS